MATVSCLFLPVMVNVELKNAVHGCNNIADLNTGVSLHSSSVLKESARYL